MSDEEMMRYVVELSRAKMLEHQGGPFAAVVVLDGKIVGEGWNCVTSSNDPTAHAEMTAIRAACESLDTYSLEGATIYTSCEPCPMCLGAIYWAHIARVFFANTTGDAAAIGFDDGICTASSRCLPRTARSPSCTSPFPRPLRSSPSGSACRTRCSTEDLARPDRLPHAWPGCDLALMGSSFLRRVDTRRQ